MKRLSAPSALRTPNPLTCAALVAVLLIGTAAPLAAAPPDPAARNAMCLKPWPENPFFWQYKGAPVILLGGSVEDNLFQIPELEAHLELLRESGGNYIRNTLSSRDEGDLWMFHQREDGLYDLERPNEPYYEKLQRLLEGCFERDIVVQFELWDRFDYAREPWLKNPFRPANNVNYTVEESGLKDRYPNHPGTNENPFFRTVPGEDDNGRVLPYQQAHIDRVLALSLPYPNVLYCMDNETNGSPRWGAYWSDYVKRRAAEQGATVQTTEMWDDWNLRGEQHRNTLDHPEQYSFVDTSQNNHKKGQEHWDNLQWVRDHLKEAPRPINHVKCYGAADGSHFGDSRDGTERFWRSLVGGAASIRFHRPHHGLGLGERARAHIRSARMFANSYDLHRATPVGAGEVLDGVEPNGAHVSAIPGEAFAIYMPQGGVVALRQSPDTPGYTVRWLDIEKSQWGEVAAAGNNLDAPGEGPWLALLAIAE